jgi:hypothetical protein
LAEAAEVISRNPTTLQLRYLQTLREIGATQNSTVVFPMPIDLVKPVLDAIGKASTTEGSSNALTGRNEASLSPARDQALPAGNGKELEPGASAAPELPSTGPAHRRRGR